jgi:hypothetical protein
LRERTKGKKRQKKDKTKGKNRCKLNRPRSQTSLEVDAGTNAEKQKNKSADILHLTCPQLRFTGVAALFFKNFFSVNPIKSYNFSKQPETTFEPN